MYLADSSEPTQIPPLAYVGGRVAEVLYSGRVAGFPSLRQINLRIPAGTSTGDLVPLWFSELERPGKAVGISIR